MASMPARPLLYMDDTEMLESLSDLNIKNFADWYVTLRSFLPYHHHPHAL